MDVQVKIKLTTEQIVALSGGKQIHFVQGGETEARRIYVYIERL